MNVAVCCSVLQCVADRHAPWHRRNLHSKSGGHHRECCSVLKCVAVCSSVLQCVAVCRSVLQSDTHLGIGVTFIRRVGGTIVNLILGNWVCDFVGEHTC